MKGLTVLIIALTMFVCTPVFADGEDTTIYTFEDEQVEGQLMGPRGALVSGRNTKSRTSSLIKVRQNFVYEMFKSVEHI